MKIMGFESTCDETSVAIVENGKEILSQVIFSQADLHKIYGGVVPELACRRHIDLIEPAIYQVLKAAKLTLSEIDGFAAAYAPGLIGAILIGLNSAKTLATIHQKPFFAINHIEAHLYAAIMQQPSEIKFPALGLILSGGHSCMVLMENIGKYQLISTTQDDALGEAFDKVAKLMDLSYPGGMAIEQLAKKGNKERFKFQAGKVKDAPLAFSFSGIKTAVRYCLTNKTKNDYQDIAASFQKAVFSDVLDKTKKALTITAACCLIAGGGVMCNESLRSLLIQNLQIPLFFPEKHLTQDNAAMIAGLAFHKTPSSIATPAKPRLAFWT